MTGYPSISLMNLLTLTKDGEWGKDEPADDYVEMSVIRGADFGSVRFGSLDGVPIRYIAERSATLKTLRPNDILIETAGGTRGRPTGRTLLLKHELFEKTSRPITCASFSRFMRANSELIQPEYLFWYLQYLYSTGYMELHQVQHTGVSRFQYTEFARKTEVPIPPPAVQHRIASILGALDDKIECNRRMNQTLEAVAQALYKHWFVDFGPFRGGEFVDSQLGQIPIGWKVRSIGELCTSQYGYTASATQEPIGPRFLRITDMNKHLLVDWETVPFCQISDSDLARYRLTESDILVSRMADPGKVIMAEGMKEQAVFASYLIRLKPNHPTMAYWLYYFLRSNVYETFISISAGGTVQKNLNAKQLTSPQIAVPTQAALEEFGKKIVPLRRQQIANQREIGLLARTRDYLLPKLLSGEIELKVAEKQVEASL